MAKRSSAKHPSSPEEWQITDEWGMADPAKAGMPALFKRLGHPVLHAAQSTPRRERRRALRPERPPDGVGLAIAEARRRAEQVAKSETKPEGKPEFETIGQSPARAMREVMKTHPPAAEPTHFVPDAAPVETSRAEPAMPAPQVDPPPAPAARKRRGGARKSEARPVEPAVAAPRVERPEARPEMPVVIAQAPLNTRATRAAQAELDRARGRRAASVRARTGGAAAPPSPGEPTPAPAKPMPPAPSPRRPRGAVPLAAWAHAVSDAPKAEPRRLDPLGFWRTWFRIPPEVALVEYARGCRIHRLLIEARAETVSDFL
jgi:hypothetical protein